jgi:tetratricopeptide (TPR) repeat protein
MKTIWADFNARTESDRVRLDTRGSIESLSKTPVSPDEWIWLTDDEVTVGAQVESAGNSLLARPAWDTVQESAPEASDAAVRQALTELRTLMTSPVRDYKAILRLIPLARRNEPKPGYLDFLKSRALAALGYSELALGAASDAVGAAPDAATFKHHELVLHDQVNHAGAMQEVTQLIGRSRQALVLEACIHVLSNDARQHSGDVDASEQILAVVSEFEKAPDRNTVPVSAVVSARLARGFALARLGRDGEARSAFSEAVDADPTNPASRFARGVATYPLPGAVEDLRIAIEAGWSNFVPHYLLSHHAVGQHRWADALNHAEAALRLFPTDHARANLLEWRAIIAYETAHDVVASRKFLLEALAIEDLPHLRENLRELERLASASSPVQSDWAVPAGQAANIGLAEAHAA